MTKTLSTKTLLASTTIALGLLAVIGTAQAAEQNSASTVGSASRKIEVVSTKQVALATQPETADTRAEAPADAPPADTVLEANQGDADVRNTNPQAETAPQAIVSEDAKRLNRDRYIKRYETRYGYEPSYEERYVEPRYTERYVEPRYAEPRYKERYVEPHYVAPHYVAPKYVAPQYVAPKYVAPHYVAPKYVAPTHYASRDTYAHRYQAAPKYGHVQYKSHRSY
jgi:hypothetical protein